MDKGFLETTYCCVATIVTSKLPIDWTIQGLQMAYKIVYLVKAYSIPLQLLINSNHIEIHLVPNVGERTWSKKVKNLYKC